MYVPVTQGGELNGIPIICLQLGSYLAVGRLGSELADEREISFSLCEFTF